MNIGEFKKISEDLYNEYFTSLYQNYLNNIYWEIIRRKPHSGPFALFPNIMLLTETRDHFILELYGAQKRFNGLDIKKHKKPSTHEYLYQFKDTREGMAMFRLDSSGAGFKNLLFTREYDEQFLDKRFPFHKKWGTRFFFTGDGKGSLFEFGSNFKSCYFDNCLIINWFGQFHRVKDILHMVIINKNLEVEEYKKLVQEILGKQPGIHLFEGEAKEEALILAGQFSNLFLTTNLHETTIGEFINRNRNILTTALECEDLLYEEEFDWLEGNPDPDEKLINPDFRLDFKTRPKPTLFEF